MDKRLKNELDTLYARLGSTNIFAGDLTPKTTETHNLGTASKRWDTIYARQVIADTISGGGPGGGDAETVDGFHASDTPTANYLMALNGSAVFPTSVYASALLQDGSRALTGNMAANAGVTFDGIDVGSHDHSGGANGVALSHGNLGNLGVDDHVQYTEWAQEEVITAKWSFSNTADDLDDYYKYVGWEIDTQLTLSGPDPVPASTWTRISSIAFSAQVGFEHDYPIVIHAGGTGSYIQVGDPGEVMIGVLESNDYRIWVGNTVAASAPFSVDKLGNLKAESGSIAGWSLSSTAISNNNIELNSSTGTITVGDGPTDILKISSTNANYLFWAGAADPVAALFSISTGGDVIIASGTITGTLESDTYVSGEAGWQLQASGFAEFENIWARGVINAVVYKENAISVIAGRTLVTDGSALVLDVIPADTTITVEASVFAQYDLINIQPDGIRNEWMSIDDNGTPVVIDSITYYEYAVTRNLNGTGAESFYIGETVFRKGTASFPSEYGLQIGHFETAYLNAYKAVIGGVPFTSLGGFITFDGTREYGPYVSVARRFGAQYNQIEDIMRFGRLQGFLGIVDNVYGFAVGRPGNYIKYDDQGGLQIENDGANVRINNSGFFTDSLAISHEVAAPDYQDGFLVLWVDDTSKTLKGRYKDGAYESESTIHTF